MCSTLQNYYYYLVLPSRSSKCTSNYIKIYVEWTYCWIFFFEFTVASFTKCN